ncbi:hypothetical protein AKJ09_10193 [Labilithrix luteola]|uniref:Uncharacterized protein n=1 Tax=Labilithrix luteola TaxID=1391654 RepID=A0A0K1QDL9_9BACT|nr:hypothetical protein AKJ09_10193 [Labilithrix luteola]
MLARDAVGPVGRRRWRHETQQARVARACPVGRRHRRAQINTQSRTRRREQAPACPFLAAEVCEGRARGPFLRMGLPGYGGEDVA